MLHKIFTLLSAIRESRTKLPAGFYLVLFWLMCTAVIVWCFYRRYTM